MERLSHGESAVLDGPSEGERDGLYLYCVVPDGDCGRAELGEIGLDSKPVYTISEGGLRAVVHECPARPYENSDTAVVSAWVMAHHGVVERAWQRWGAALPLSFNTVVRPGQINAEQSLRGWFETNRASLEARLEAVAGKAEYSVQLYWDTGVITRRIAEGNTEARRLAAEMRSLPRGTAYMYRQKLQNLLKRELEKLAAQEMTHMYTTVSRLAEKVRVEKLKQGNADLRMVVNLSCLVQLEKTPAMREGLDRVAYPEGYTVRLAGPFPPYSFC